MIKFTRQNIKYSFLILSWALYDLANQFFALNIVSLYFPRWLIIEKGAFEIFYSLAFGISIFLVAISAPIFGAISDTTGRRRAFLIFFTLLSVIFTMCLGLSGSIFLALVFFAIANFGCQGAIIFYNSLLAEIAPKNRVGFVSGLGRMFGYSGALLALYFTKPVVLKMGYRPTFFLTGILFLIFSLPCMVFVSERPPKEKIGFSHFLKKQKLLEIFNRLKTTVFASYKFEGLKNFLKAAFFGLCVVNTIILFMSVYATKVFGLTESELISLIAFSTIFAIAGSIVSGFISDIVGHRRSMIGVFFLWAICILAGGLLDTSFCWLAGAMAGISLGATWVISRALVIKLVPSEKIGEAFGIFIFVGHLSGIIGSLFWGLLLLYLAKFGEIGYRLSFLSLLLFIAIGANFLSKVSEKELKY